ncbi:hypothetical protein BGZ65_010097 [Modicella reniformis]|uniref:Uncharacterized protein n=1 Tax=Modicella reniformis TaxID=1440133 RepID=A0A9P6LW82_9FUNG|nr:hypothetical protein BGZ65_010097 [Modicella reniformis]
MGWAQENIPDITGPQSNANDPNVTPRVTQAKDVNETEQDGTEDAEDIQYTFNSGHIIHWWRHYARLPPEVRPVFVPTAGFRDTFQQMSERFLILLLWGQKNKEPASTKAIMESRICSYEDAVKAENSNYGELMRKLFVGDKNAIRKAARKRQTSYGKRTSTMSRLSTESQAFSAPSLQQYIDSKFAYIKAKKNALATGSEVSLSPPTLPSSNPTAQYALSNQLFTDGIQVHVMAFDTRKPQVSANQRSLIPKLEERFPSRPSIVNDLGSAFEDTIVVGIDPGEKISAAFCMVDPKTPTRVSNLCVRRNALYSPALAYRTRLEDIKRRRVTVNAGDCVSPTMWTRPSSSKNILASESFSESELGGYDAVELPSINELQQSLGQLAFQSVEQHQEGLRQYAQVFEILQEFYASRSLKKLHWERVKAMRAEKDLAVHGAIRMVPRTEGQSRQAIFVYGDGRFNTRTKLATMHETFKNYFVMKVFCRLLML